MRLDDVGCAIGRGLLAGLCGTAAITISTSVEMKLRARAASTAPADAALKVLRLQPVDDRAKEQFSNAVHWGYGAGWGLVRGLLDLAGCGNACAYPTHFGAIWGTALVMLPTLEVAPPVTSWPPEDVAIDAFHHAVYVAATGLVYNWLTGRTQNGRSCGSGSAPRR